METHDDKTHSDLRNEILDIMQKLNTSLETDGNDIHKIIDNLNTTPTQSGGYRTKRSAKTSVKRSRRKSVKKSAKKSTKRSAKKSVKKSVKKSAKRSRRKYVKKSAKRSSKSSVKHLLKKSNKTDSENESVVIKYKHMI